MNNPQPDPTKRTTKETVPDPHRWESIARRHGPTVRAYALSLTRDHHQAADLTQEVLLRARRAPDHPADELLRAWLRQVTHNLFIDDYRHRQRHPTVPLPPQPSLLPTIPPTEETTDHLDPFTLAALLQLPHHQREPVALRDLYGFSYAQIAQHTATPEGTVRSRIHRGRATLAQLMTPKTRPPETPRNHPSQIGTPQNGGKSG